MLSLNNRCGFPSMCLMENRDLLMMINSGQVPPLHVLPQPSCLRSAVLNLCLKSTQRTHVLVVWHFLWRRKDVSFPARVRWQCQRKAHSSCSWQSTGSHSPGEVCVDQRAYRSWCWSGSSARGQTLPGYSLPSFQALACVICASAGLTVLL